MTESGTSTPAESLQGLILRGDSNTDWEIVEAVTRAVGATGENFSCSYVAKGPNGEGVFVKAIDIQRSLDQSAGDPVSRTAALLTGYERERDLLHACLRMSRVVSLRDSGLHRFPQHAIPVPFLVFEQARGDVRTTMSFPRSDYAMTLTVLHQVAVGLGQLHNARIVHQDLKPSNVLAFEEGEHKPTDLGRASQQGFAAWWDDLPIPGQFSYAPPELRYGYISSEWLERRMLSDFYQLGSLMAFFLTAATMPALLEAKLQPHHRVGTWGGTYEEILPVLSDAFAEVIEELAAVVPEALGEVVDIIQSLCEPDVSRRGRRGFAKLSVRSLDRYVSRLDYLAKTADMRAIGTRE